MTTRSTTPANAMRSLARRRKQARPVLALALACLALSGCGAHLPLLHRGGTVPAAARAGSPHSAPAANGAASAVAPLAGAAAYRFAVRSLAADSAGMAEEQLREALALTPGYAPALSLLSKVYFQSGRHGEAVALLQPVLERQADFTPAERRVLLAGLALHHDALGQRDLAREAIAAAALADCDQTVSAEVYLRLRGDAPDSAEAPAREALAHDGASAVHLNNFGITRLRAGDLEGARKAFTGAVKRDPSLPGPYYNLAILEKFYRFDADAGAQWFAAYWRRSHDDPDGLRGAFPADLATVPVPGVDRP